jgi:hypothetical protein
MWSGLGRAGHKSGAIHADYKKSLKAGLRKIFDLKRGPDRSVGANAEDGVDLDSESSQACCFGNVKHDAKDHKPLPDNRLTDSIEVIS